MQIVGKQKGGKNLVRYLVDNILEDDASEAQIKATYGCVGGVEGSIALLTYRKYVTEADRTYTKFDIKGKPVGTIVLPERAISGIIIGEDSKGVIKDKTKEVGSSSLG